MKYSLLILLLLSSLVNAVTVDDFYATTVEVQSRDQQAFKLAAQQAAINVLVKASGQPRAFVASEPRIAGDLLEAYRWVEQFSYRQKNQPLLEGDLPLLLTLKFPEGRIVDWLQKGGLKLWLNNRPLTLILPVVQAVANQQSSSAQEAKLKTAIFSLAIDENASSPEGDLSYEQKMAAALGKYSKQLGLPITGLSDEANAGLRANSRSIDRLWQLDNDQMRQVSRSVENDAVFTARIAITSSGRFIGDWFLLESDNSSYIDISANNADEFVAKGFAWLAKHYSKQYAMRLQGAHNEYSLTIQSVDNHEDYQQLIHYLEQHELIEKVYLLEANRSFLMVSLSLKTGLAQLEKAFLLDKKLHKLERLTEYQLNYQWLK